MPLVRSARALVVAAVGGSLVACAGPARSGAPEAGSIAAIATELDRLGGIVAPREKAAFADILADGLAKDPYVCRPSPREVFFGPAPEGSRTLHGVMPHYGFFNGPMHYVVQRSQGRWEVRVTIEVTLPPEGGRMELPDCTLARELQRERGPGAELASIGAICEGTAYGTTDSIEVCPASGAFSVPATHHAMRALLARWSIAAEEYYNRDARAFDLPVHYDFELVPAPVDPAQVDLSLPLSLTCGRTPYFTAFRSGWSLPIVAHEVGHVLGMLDEYEALSGITGLYPKTPFPGAERSRMAMSMRETSRVLPLHHYLVLRRYFCPAPERSFYERAPL